MVSNLKLHIDLPSEDIGFVEDKRSFVVEGTIEGDIPLGSILEVKLIDINNNILRYVKTDRKNQDIDCYYNGLTCYPEELDNGRFKMQEFGFPLLIDNGNINKASNKAWYSDNKFKAIITNDSYGYIFKYDFPLLDDNGLPFDLLKKGEYVIEVSLANATVSKKIVIGERNDQIICRFNPLSHKENMISWCNDNGYAIIKDTLPGYLDSYLGIWLYHMGLLKTYRANDIVLFEKAHIRMFVYLIDETSTSYATELAYLQANSVLNNKDRFTVYRYDIGEANIFNRKASIEEFDEYMHIYRVDVVSDKAQENIYYLDNRYVKDIIFDLDNIVLNVDTTIAITGATKPIQLDCEDFILNDDNTYTINNCPYINRYSFICEDNIYVEEHFLNMERIDDISIGKSVYEFYNLITIKQEWKNKQVRVLIENIDKKNNVLGSKQLVINVKE